MSYNVLLIDDNIKSYDLINAFSLKHKLFYIIKNIKSTIDLQDYLKDNPVDLILMTSLMKDVDRSGLVLVKEIKLCTATSSIPIILCSASESWEDQMKSLDDGADDYYRKSSPLEILFSKMNAILRKIDKARHDHCSMMKRFLFLEDSLEVEYLGKKHQFSHKEFMILQILVKNPNKIFSQETLNKLTSGDQVFVSKRCIDTFINLIRKKIGKEIIVSIRKKGYRLNEKLAIFNCEIE